MCLPLTVVVGSLLSRVSRDLSVISHFSLRSVLPVEIVVFLRLP